MLVVSESGEGAVHESVRVHCGRVTFSRVLQLPGLATVSGGKVVATADVNADGTVDLVVGGTPQSSSLYM